MIIWKPASAVFVTGASQVTALKGRKVRLKTELLGVAVFDPIHHTQLTVDLPAEAIGFIANPHPQQAALLIAFSPLANAPGSSLEMLRRSDTIKVVTINEPTFKARFEVQVS